MAACKLAHRRSRKAPASRQNITVTLTVPVWEKAVHLDREADHALAWGQHQRAETLSRRAAELRGLSA